MDNHKSLVNWIFTTLVAIVSFFLFMFYKKVDSMNDNINDIKLSNAIKEMQITSLSDKVSNLEKAVNELTHQAQLNKAKP